VGDLRLEIATWRDTHARIWEAFGPDAGSGRPTAGIGGPGQASILERDDPRPPAAVQPVAVDDLEQLVAAVQEEGRGLQALERLMRRAGRALAALPSRWPVRGSVNSDFGARRSESANAAEFHGGIDIAAERGTEVRAPAPGTVAFAGAHGDYGITVILDHGQDVRTLFGHLSRLAVKPGQPVERGQVIAVTGNTGRSSGPHLHYEIQVAGRPVNPRSFLWD
jgi:murein DD-endopeptidase MepM/ murein hydrolase activator NlpD